MWNLFKSKEKKEVIVECDSTDDLRLNYCAGDPICHQHDWKINEGNSICRNFDCDAKHQIFKKEA